MSRPLFARAASRPAVECVVPWIEEARLSVDRWELAIEMLAESSSRFRLWLVAMTPAERSYAAFEAASETLRRWPQVAVWKESGQRGLDRLNAKLDLENPLAARLVVDFSRPFKASDLAEALVAGKRRPAAFGMAAGASESRLAASRELERSGTVRIDTPQKALFGAKSQPIEGESSERRLRPMGLVRKIRTTGAT